MPHPNKNNNDQAISGSGRLVIVATLTPGGHCSARPSFAIPPLVWPEFEFPVGRGKAFGGSMHPVLDTLLGGWQLNGNWTLQSGFPVAFPNAAPLAARSAVLPGSERTRERWFDTSLWQDPATGRTVPVQAPFTLRDFPTRFPDVRFPALKNLDLSLFKDFHFSERVRLNFRGEFYNVTNTPWFPQIGTTSVTAANFGSLNLAQTNGPRRLNLGMRLVW
jgi:hypothetical protein